MAVSLKDHEIQHDISVNTSTHTTDTNVAHQHNETSDTIVGFEADEDSLPKGYFRSRFFIGTFMAIGLSLWAGTGALYVSLSL